MTVAITRLELNAGDLRQEAKCCRNAAAARRMFALALVLEGHVREAAARHAGMNRQTLRDWVHRYHAQGLAGLHNRPHLGPKPRLAPEQMTELESIVEQGPDPERDGIVRWRRVDLQVVIERRFGVHLHERSVGKVLRRLGFARISVRPKHPSSDPAAQAAFQKASPSWCRRPYLSTLLASRSRSGFKTRPESVSRAP
jgi:transposase